MATRRRRVTPILLAESAALVRSVETLVAILTDRHPASMPVAIITQQLAALAEELAAQTPEPEARVPAAAGSS